MQRFKSLLRACKQFEDKINGFHDACSHKVLPCCWGKLQISQ